MADATHVEPTSGTAKTGTASAGEFRLFRSATKISANSVVTVVVEPTTNSDPNVYASFSQQTSTGKYLVWAASGGNGETETLTIAADTANRNTVDSYPYISVYGYNPTSFAITITVDLLRHHNLQWPWHLCC